MRWKELDEGKVSELMGAATYLAAAGYGGYTGVKAAGEAAVSAFSQPAHQSSVTYNLGPARDVDDNADDSDVKAEATPDRKSATLLALTIWGEARSHGKEGMNAVAHVVQNRIHSKRKFGKNVSEVVWKRKAFSCWNPSDPNREAMKDIAQLPKNSLDYKRWNQAKQIAAQVLAGDGRDPTRGALFYHTAEVDPKWADGVRPIASVANHLFYRDDAKATKKQS